MKTSFLSSLILIGSMSLCTFAVVQAEDVVDEATDQNTKDAMSGHWLLAKYDLDGDERITPDEITARKLSLFRRMDFDSDGGVSFEEYEKMDVAKRETLLKARFGKLDTDHDGHISEKEYSHYLGLFSSIDVNGDGALTAQEMTNETNANLKSAELEESDTHCLLWVCIRTSLD